MVFGGSSFVEVGVVELLRSKILLSNVESLLLVVRGLDVSHRDLLVLEGFRSLGQVFGGRVVILHFVFG